MDFPKPGEYTTQPWERQDFRHTLKRQMRRAGVHPVVVRDTLGHSKVEQQDVYDKAQRTEVGDALRLVGKQLEPRMEPNRPVS
jgi:hypothetical protein